MKNLPLTRATVTFTSDESHMNTTAFTGHSLYLSQPNLSLHVILEDVTSCILADILLKFMKKRCGGLQAAFLSVWSVTSVFDT